MIQQENIKTFDELSGKYSTWIIKYHSAAFEKPLFLVWYTDTDENRTDRFLTYKDGKIFAVTSLTNLKAILLYSSEKLVEFENLYPWLDNFSNLDVKEWCTYDLNSIENEINNNNLNIETIESFVIYINLFGDFVNQDKRNNHLQVYVDNKPIRATWDYFYNYIFWPRFNDKKNLKIRNRPKLKVDTKELSEKLKDIIKAFDDNIHQTEKIIC
ncbi:hypothetical protein LC612_38670 [Nostoc sp. CHAB 5834]|nr:hypothetical protein [Nostoc sp. CHAB 5834]